MAGGAIIYLHINLDGIIGTCFYYVNILPLWYIFILFYSIVTNKKSINLTIFYADWWRDIQVV